MNKTICLPSLKNKIDRDFAELWSKYNQENEEEFWIHYYRLLNSAGANYKETNIQHVRQNPDYLPFASVLRISPKKRKQFQKVIKENKPSTFPVVMGVLSWLISLPFLTNPQTIELSVIGALLLTLSSVGFLLYGANKFIQYGRLRDLFGTVLEVNNACIARVYGGRYTKLVKFKDITTVNTEDFGLIIKVKNQSNQEVNALTIPFAMEQFDQLKAFLFQQVHKNNHFQPTLQGLNVTK